MTRGLSVTTAWYMSSACSSGVWAGAGGMKRLRMYLEWIQAALISLLLALVGRSETMLSSSSVMAARRNSQKSLEVLLPIWCSSCSCWGSQESKVRDLVLLKPSGSVRWMLAQMMHTSVPVFSEAQSGSGCWQSAHTPLCTEREYNSARISAPTASDSSSPDTAGPCCMGGAKEEASQVSDCERLRSCRGMPAGLVVMMPEGPAAALRRLRRRQKEMAFSMVEIQVGRSGSERTRMKRVSRGAMIWKHMGSWVVRTLHCSKGMTFL